MMDQLQTKEYLLIDLSSKHSERREISPDILEEYPSGVALATYLLEHHMPPGTDPLAPESTIVITQGLMAGLPYPGATRFAMTAKSPLTNCWAGGTMGGEFAWALSRSGVLALVIQGRAPDWSYLLLDEDRLFFRQAAFLLGKSIDEVKTEIKQTWGQETALLGVGPAGEVQIRFATLSDGSPERGLRGGLGAIFGSKQLKALLIRPNRPVEIGQLDNFINAAAPLHKSLSTLVDAPVLEMGLPSVLRKLDQSQSLPSHNFQTTGFEESWFDTVENLDIKKRSCIGCPFSCVRLHPLVDDSSGKKDQTLLPIFPEHLWALGPLLDVNNVENTLQALKACLKTGLDPVSMGVVAAWIAECLENGIDLGIDFRDEAGFRNGRWLASLPEQVTTEPRTRDLLGMGVLKAAEKSGPNAMAFAMHFWGQELSCMDLRSASWPLSYLGPAFDFPGLNGLPGPASSENEPAAEIIGYENRWALLETLGLCHRASAAQEDLMGSLVLFCQFVTDAPVSSKKLSRWSQNCVNLIKNFDWREGWRPLNLTLADKFFTQDLYGPENVFQALDQETWRARMIRYFSLRGWSSEGKPAQQSGG